MVDLSAAEAADSPCTRYVCRGGAGRSVGHCIRALVPACAGNDRRVLASVAAGKAWNAVRVFKLADDVHEGLRAAHGERWHHDYAASLRHAIDDIGQCVLR